MCYYQTDPFILKILTVTFIAKYIVWYRTVILTPSKHNKGVPKCKANIKDEFTDPYIYKIKVVIRLCNVYTKQDCDNFVTRLCRINLFAITLSQGYAINTLTPLYNLVKKVKLNPTMNTDAWL